MIVKPMQYDLFGTFLDTMQTEIKVRPRTKLEEAIFRQKNESAWQTEQARKKAALEEENRKFNLVIKISEMAASLQSKILSAIDAGKFSCIIDIPEDVWRVAVKSTKEGYRFSEELMFGNELNDENDLSYQTQVLAASGVSYSLDESAHMMDYGPDWVRRYLTLSW